VTQGCRIRSVRYKGSGFVLHRLEQPIEKARRALMQETAQMVDEFHRDGRVMVGYALVIWDASTASSATIRCGAGSTIPSIAMPDFVRNRVLAAKIEEWGKS
jgi:hypothetical protein